MEITLTWAGSDSDAGDTLTYDLYFGTTSDPQLYESGLTSNSYTIKNLAYFQLYYWKVVSKDINGIETSSPVQSFIIDAEPVPEAPNDLKASIGGGIDLSWIDNSDNEYGFKIERKTGANGTYSQLAVVGADIINYFDSYVDDDTTYFYRLRAFNGSGNSGYSDEVSIATSTTVLCPDAAPEISSLTPHKKRDLRKRDNN